MHAPGKYPRNVPISGLRCVMCDTMRLMDAGREEAPRRCRRRTRGQTRRRCRVGRDRVEDRDLTQLREDDACVALAGCAEVRE
eukprot:3966680-Prymnesium_polylepis.1